MSDKKTRHAESKERSEKLRRQVADCLTAAMARKRLTAEQLIELSAVAKLTRSSVSLYRHGAVLPSHDRLAAMLAACGETMPEEIDLAYHAAANSHMSQVRGQESAKEFVITWQSSDSINEVSEKLGLTYASVASRAKIYRSKGVNLKKYERCGKIDVDDLNDLID